MTDSHQQNPDDRRKQGQEAFTRFLECLSPDAEEAGQRYTRLHGKLTGFFRMRGIADPMSAADETLDRAMTKIMDGADVPSVDKYCMGIARNIVKERLRLPQREATAFTNFIEYFNTADGQEELQKIYLIQKPCFEQLSDEDQKLLVAYCQVERGRARAEHRRKLAEIRQTTLLALRMRVTRLRVSLADCVEKRLREN